MADHGRWQDRYTELVNAERANLVRNMRNDSTTEELLTLLLAQLVSIDAHLQLLLEFRDGK